MSTTSIDHHLVNDAILARGRMAKHLSWGAYHGLVQKYLKLSRVRDESERVYVRALVALLENLHFLMEELVPNLFNLDIVNEERLLKTTEMKTLLSYLIMRKVSYYHLKLLLELLTPSICVFYPTC